MASSSQAASFEQPRGLGTDDNYDFLLMNKTFCEIVSELQENWLYTVLVGAKFVLCILGAILSVVQWWKRGVRWLIHANSRTLFTYYYGVIVFQGAVYAVLYGFEFTRLRFPCFYFDFRYVLVVRTAGIAAIVASHYVIVSISLERLYSSIYPLKFEKSTRKIFGIVIASTIIFVAFFLIFFAISDNFRLFGRTKLVATIDLRTPDNSEAYSIAFLVMTYTFVPSSLIFGVDYYLNFHRKERKRSGDRLAISYQYSENRMVISTLIPLEIINSFMTIFATVAQSIYNAINPETTYSARAIFLECTSLSPIYPLAFAIILEWRARVRIRKHWSFVHNIRESHKANDHFAQLQKQWQSRP